MTSHEHCSSRRKYTRAKSRTHFWRLLIPPLLTSVINGGLPLDQQVTPVNCNLWCNIVDELTCRDMQFLSVHVSIIVNKAWGGVRFIMDTVAIPDPDLVGWVGWSIYQLNLGVILKLRIILREYMAWYSFYVMARELTSCGKFLGISGGLLLVINADPHRLKLLNTSSHKTHIRILNCFINYWN